MMRTQLKIAAVVSTLCMGIAYPASAATTEWVDGRGLKKVIKQLAKNEQIPTAISCKEGKGGPKSQKGTLFKVTFKNNTKLIWWKWAWGSDRDFDRNARRPLSEGYKVASSDAFKRSTNQTTKCAIFHHPTKHKQ